MTWMEGAQCRNYRGHVIIARKTFLGLLRHDVWKRNSLIGTFRDGILAELHVDSLVGKPAWRQ